MKEMFQSSQNMQGDLVKWRRHIHANPEIGMELPKTSAFVVEKLEEMGYKPELVAGYGVTVLAGGKNPGKCILIRADMDALPIKEESGVEFCSTNENMHACGHDLHTTMLLGAAKLLKEQEDKIQGTIKLMFQPAEETLRGAEAMVNAGILENPKVDAALMIHVMAGLPFPSGMVLVPDEGAFASASDWFEVTIQGKGGHGAMPDTTVDPLNVISHLHLALQAINSREVPPSETVVVTVGEMHGGDTSNVIPDTAYLKGTVRTFNEDIRKFVCQRIPEIANGIAQTFRATADAKIIKGCPSVFVDKNVADDVRSSLKETFGQAVVDPAMVAGMKMSGSEDFSYVSEKVPAVMMALSAGSPQEGYQYGMHHPMVKFNEDVLAMGASVYAVSAMGWLEKNK